MLTAGSTSTFFDAASGNDCHVAGRACPELEAVVADSTAGLQEGTSLACSAARVVRAGGAEGRRFSGQPETTSTRSRPTLSVGIGSCVGNASGDARDAAGRPRPEAADADGADGLREDAVASMARGVTSSTAGVETAGGAEGRRLA
jgi:hypothetical protein